jgi:hypothetical protein
LKDNLSRWFRQIAFPELGEDLVREAVIDALGDPERSQAFRDWRKEEYFLTNVQKLVDAYEARRAGAAPHKQTWSGSGGYQNPVRQRPAYSAAYLAYERAVEASIDDV